jgi:hypothetical protein
VIVCFFNLQVVRILQAISFIKDPGFLSSYLSDTLLLKLVNFIMLSRRICSTCLYYMETVWVLDCPVFSVYDVLLSYQLHSCYNQHACEQVFF